MDLNHKIFLVIWFSLFSLFIFSTAWSQERFEFYNGARQMAMGGASIAVVNDETALLSNPAGLGKLRDSIITVLDPEIEINSTDSSILGGHSTSGLQNIDTLETILKDSPDKRFHSKTQMFPSFVVPNFGFGIFGKYSYDAEIVTTNDVPTAYHLDYVNDFALIMGYNFRFWEGRIKLGFNLRFINRAEVHDDLNPDNAEPYELSKIAYEGAGIGSDIGLILTAPWAALPTLAIVARDMGGTRYTVGSGLMFNGVGRPPTTPQTYDAAFALFPIVGKNNRVAFTAEMQDITNVSEDTDSLRRAHVGVELNISDMLFLRAGMNQRYWTGGFEFSTPYFQFQASSYGEDIGTPGSPREDRRLVGKFSIRF